MELCKLCGLKEATQTNSHIITLALIKEALNHSNIKKRDYEVAFMLSNTDIPKSYFGRNVSPEHIEEVLGRSLTEKEIDENKNPFSEDFIFCPDCEKKIGVLETEFINRIYSKIIRVNIENLPADRKGNRIFKLNFFDNNLTYLFCYSIFFRASIANKNNHELDFKIKEYLRQILNSLLSTNVDALIDNIQEFKESDLKYSIILSFLESAQDVDKTGNLILFSNSKQPHFVWANNIAIFLFEKESHITSSIEYLFGFSQALDYSEYINRSFFEEMKICILPNYKIQNIINYTLNFIAEQNMKFFKTLFNDMCRKLLNRRSTENEKKLFGYHFSNTYTDKNVTDKKEAFIKAFLMTFNIKESN